MQARLHSWITEPNTEGPLFSQLLNVQTHATAGDCTINILIDLYMCVCVCIPACVVCIDASKHHDCMSAICVHYCTQQHTDMHEKAPDGLLGAYPQQPHQVCVKPAAAIGHLFELATLLVPYLGFA
jgi:hypothetical protein